MARINMIGYIMLVLIVVNFNGAYGAKVQDESMRNMFKSRGETTGTSRAFAVLESKLKGSDDRCVGAWFGQLCESDSNKFVDDVYAEISMIAEGVVRVNFKDRNNEKRWDLTHLNGFIEDKQPDDHQDISSVGFQFTGDENFAIKFTDPKSKEFMFDTTGGSLIFTDKYIEYEIKVSSQTLFGLGQHNAKFLLQEGEWTMFNRDQPGSPEATGQGKQHLYGTHPFLMAKTKDHKFEGILFYSSNPQQVSITYTDNGSSLLTYKTIGGILDVYIFAADSADEIIKKYNELVGLPSLPPFWGLGFHQCSWQYNTTDDMRAAVNGYQSNGYLFDTIWTDIMYMDDYIDFTVDDTTHGDIKDFIDELHNQNLHFVPIVDAGVSINTDHHGVSWYEKGKEQDVFMKTTKNPDAYDGNLIAQVWPGYTAFVDFFNPNSQSFWSEGLEALYDQMPFDGLWLDMNEPSNFCQDESGNPIGECYPQSKDREWSGVQRKLIKQDTKKSPVEAGEFDDVPFKPGEENLDYKTLSMDAFFSDSQDNGTFVMYNAHNMYGTLETMSTYNYLTSKDTRRPLIISRDSFVGHGRYGSIWTGDNDANFNDMKLSISQIMSFNMFGMPFVGGDICGFTSNTTPELCARWAQVGAFYPFMRNHYAIGKSPQEFYLFDEKYQKGMKESLRQRYSLLRYYYTQLYKSSAFGLPTVRHPMYDWPEHLEMIKDENTFMIGKSVRVTANWNDNTNDDFKAYFPKGRWFDYHEFKMLEIDSDIKMIDLYTGWDYTNVHFKEASIIPVQETDELSHVTRTHDLLERTVDFIVIPDASGSAKGELFVARGETTDEAFAYYTITLKDNKFEFKQEASQGQFNGVELNNVLKDIRILDDSVLDSDTATATLKSGTEVSLQVYKKTSESGQDYLHIGAMGVDVQFDNLDSITFGKS